MKEETLGIKDKRALERMIDSTSLYQVVLALANIAQEKGQRIVGAYQDKPTDQPWFQASNELDGLLSLLNSLDV